jgi:hypothetical protein
MSESVESAPPRRIDAVAKAAFLAALRAGARREDAAAEAGFSLMGFYGARHRDPEFAAGWTEALAAAPAAERRASAYEKRGWRREDRIASANRRFSQRRRRLVRFDAGRQAVYLAHFAVTADMKAAAAEAGISVSTVKLHRRHDPAFAEAHEEALEQAYFFLQAEAVRLRLEAAERLRAAGEGAEYPPRDGKGERVKRGGGGPASAQAPTCPHCGRSDDSGAEFDRTLRLLKQHNRSERRPEGRFKLGGRRQRWTFVEVMTLLEKAMRGMGVKIEPEPDAAKGDLE